MMKTLAAMVLAVPAAALADPAEPAAPNEPSQAAALIAQNITPPTILPGEPCKSRHRITSPSAAKPTGNTIITYSITTDGSVRDELLQQSSGSDMLDKISLECAATYSYKPAMKDGQPVAVPWKLQYRWVAAHP